MNIKVKNTEPGGRQISFAINKSTSVLDLKKLVKNDFGVTEECQRLYFRGKLMENPIKVYDYGLSMNKTIQLVVRSEGRSPEKDKKTPRKSKEKETPCENAVQKKVTPTKVPKKKKSSTANNISKYFRVGDWVDFKDVSSEDTAFQGWFEGRIVDIVEYSSDDDPNNSEILFEVQHRRSATEAPIFVSLNELRPISRMKIKPQDLNVGDTVLANYNTLDPTKRGYWFDFIAEKINRNSARTIIHGTIIAGSQVLENCVMMYPNELMKIEPVKLFSERTTHERKVMQTEPTSKRYCAAACSSCMDIPGRKCRQCGCAVCFSKKDPEKQLICDECQNYFHVYCLKKPLDKLPEGDWFCENCQNPSKRTPRKTEPKKTDCEPDEKEESNNSRCKKTSMDADNPTPKNSVTASPGKVKFGHVNNVEVGTTFRFKGQVVNSGLHFRLDASLASIHSRVSHGVYSVILDKDFDKIKDAGDELVFSLPAKGPRMKTIKAFASNCPVPFNTKKKVEPSNWKEGKPVRIIRGHQLQSKFSPKVGFRYDGLYKVQKYYLEGSGSKSLWQFHLRRDDDTPAPWTEKGKKRTSDLGLNRVIRPKNSEGAVKNASNATDTVEQNETTDQFSDLDKTMELIERDTENSSTWKRLKKCLPSEKELFIKNVSREFTCKSCQKLVHIPITTPCGHNCCLGCLQKMFKEKNFTCPSCNSDLGSKYLLLRNHRLREILLNSFPGYDEDR